MKSRQIKLSFPTGKLKMTLWGGTEDERDFTIKSSKSRPYVVAYGKKYYLTNKEIVNMNKLIDFYWENV